MGALKTAVRWCKACAVGTAVFVSLVCACIVVGFMVFTKMPQDEDDGWEAYEEELAAKANNATTTDDGANGTANGTSRLLRIGSEGALFDQVPLFAARLNVLLNRAALQWDATVEAAEALMPHVDWTSPPPAAPAGHPRTGGAGEAAKAAKTR